MSDLANFVAAALWDDDGTLGRTSKFTLTVISNAVGICHRTGWVSNKCIGRPERKRIIKL
jgi:hypothetical protein